MSLAVVRYHEIALKRGNRRRFTSVLAKNIRRVCCDLPVGTVFDRHGRLIVELREDEAWPTLRERLSKTFGIANFSFCRTVPTESLVRPDGTVDLTPLEEEVLRAVEGRSFRTFRIDTRRADKGFPRTSPELNVRLGRVVQERTGAGVDLGGADLTVTLEVLSEEVLVSSERVPGPGGLPVGASGHVVALLSGGIDSPVAALRLMRRGGRVTFVHFHSSPYLDRSSQEKSRELARHLAAWQTRVRLVLVPFGELQREIVTRVEPPPRVILYRRMMLRIASAVAQRIRAEALVTGESLGQVASQTLRNLAVIEDAAELPVLRPLIGMDKIEVVDEARRLGTYETSIEPDQDCCSLFVPRHPETKARLERMREAESRLDVDALVRRALDEASVEQYEFPAEDPRPLRVLPLVEKPEEVQSSAPDP